MSWTDLRENWHDDENMASEDFNEYANRINDHSDHITAAEGDIDALESTVSSHTATLATKGSANGYASLDSGGKVPISQLPNSIMEYQGVWNASTNSPTLANGTGSTGDVYRVGTAGTRNLGSGNITFDVGDYAVYNGTTWEKSDTTDAVGSVNGYTGTVTLVKADLSLGNVDNTSDATKNAASVTLTNKTLTTPRIGTSLLDSNGATSIGITATASAVNYLQAVNSATGNAVQIQALGSDSNIQLRFVSKGSSGFKFWNNGAAVLDVFPAAGTAVNNIQILNATTTNGPQIQAIGFDTNIDLLLTTSGTGRVKANGVEVVTLTGTQTLTNKTLTNPKVEYFLDPNNGLTSFSVASPTSAVNYIRVLSNATTGRPSFNAVGSDTNIGMIFVNKANSSFTFRSDFSGVLTTALDITPTSGGVNSIQVIGATTGNAPAISGTGSDTNVNLNLTTKGTGVVQANGVEIVTLTGTQTLNNKLLSTPRINNPQINNIYDYTNNTRAALFTAPVAAVNYWSLQAAASGASCSLTATGSDTDVSAYYGVKGAGTFNFWVDAGYSTVTIRGQGADTNINTNIVSKGTGVVQANGVQVDTISGVATLTNKTLTSPTINTPAIANATSLSVGTSTNSGTTTPICVNLGGTYGTNTAGTAGNQKINLLNDGTNAWGIGVGSDRIEYQSGSGTSHRFYIGGVEALRVFGGSGTGLQAFGVDMVSVSAAQTLTNKTITTPTVSTPVINDINGNSLLLFSSNSSAVNYLNIQNAATANAVRLTATGSDANVPLRFIVKGTGNVSFKSDGGTAPLLDITPVASAVNSLQLVAATTGNAPSIYATGSDTNVDLVLYSQAGGLVKVNGTGGGSAVVTRDGTLTLANKTLTSPKINTLYDTNGNISINLSASASAVNYLTMVNSATGGSVSLRAAGSDTDIAAYLFSKGVGAAGFRSDNGFIFAGTAAASAVNYLQVSGTATGVAPGIAATGSDTNISTSFASKGTGSHQFYGQSNSVPAFKIYPQASGVNRLTISDAITSGRPNIYAEGADTNIGIELYSKGTGVINLRSSTNGYILTSTAVASAVNYFGMQATATGNGVRLWSDGTDTNVDMLLETKGTGRIKENGNVVSSFISAAPSSSGATGKIGQRFADASFTYECIAPNTWTKTAVTYTSW